MIRGGRASFQGLLNLAQVCGCQPSLATAPARCSQAPGPCAPQGSLFPFEAPERGPPRSHALARPTASPARDEADRTACATLAVTSTSPPTMTATARRLDGWTAALNEEIRELVAILLTEPHWQGNPLPRSGHQGV